MRQLPPDKGLTLNFMNDPFKMSDDGCNYTLNMVAKVVDMSDKFIVDDIIKAAKEAGIASLVLLDKKFIIEAINEKLKREELKNEDDNA